jgi:hypothetical protein
MALLAATSYRGRGRNQHLPHDAVVQFMVEKSAFTAPAVDFARRAIPTFARHREPSHCCSIFEIAVPCGLGRKRSNCCNRSDRLLPDRGRAGGAYRTSVLEAGVGQRTPSSSARFAHPGGAECDRIEREEAARILFAVASASRAWGFPQATAITTSAVTHYGTSSSGRSMPRSTSTVGPDLACAPSEVGRGG